MLNPGGEDQALSDALRPTVLVVDDDELFRRSMVSILRAEGFPCEVAGSGEEARRVLHTVEGVGAVLCDLNMPGEGGLALLAHLAEDHPELAVVMSSGIDDPQVAARAVESGADGYLIKPFHINELLVALATAVKRRELEQARRQQMAELERTLSRTRRLSGLLQELVAPEAVGDTDHVVRRLTAALSLPHEETRGHLERVSRHAALLARALGRTENEVQQVQLGAALHDVGKIGVPDAVLLKAGPLEEDELQTMRRHAQIGYQLLSGSRSEVLGTAAEVALTHHEWWNGSGYPQGLRGDEIPEAARITAIAEVFDALTSHRVYRPALGTEEAVARMTAWRGLQFEPRLVDLMVEHLDEAVDLRRQHPDDPAESARLRLLVIDDHEDFVRSLVRVLAAQPDLVVVGTAGSVAEGCRAAVSEDPDVVLMDFELPDGDGVAATTRLKMLTPRAKVVMLTGRTDVASKVHAVAAGCAGFVSKTEPTAVLLQAVRNAHRGDALGDVEPLAELLTRLPPTHRGLGADLSSRELEALRLIARGHSDEQIGDLMGMSRTLVGSVVARLELKLQAHTRLEVVANAVREGLIEVETSREPV
jgi:putative two-component system response regulator